MDSPSNSHASFDAWFASPTADRDAASSPTSSAVAPADASVDTIDEHARGGTRDPLLPILNRIPRVRAPPPALAAARRRIRHSLAEGVTGVQAPSVLR